MARKQYRPMSSREVATAGLIVFIAWWWTLYASRFGVIPGSLHVGLIVVISVVAALVVVVAFRTRQRWGKGKVLSQVSRFMDTWEPSDEER